MRPHCPHGRDPDPEAPVASQSQEHVLEADSKHLHPRCTAFLGQPLTAFNTLSVRQGNHTTHFPGLWPVSNE